MAFCYTLDLNVSTEMEVRINKQLELNPTCNITFNKAIKTRVIMSEMQLMFFQFQDSLRILKECEAEVDKRNGFPKTISLKKLI